MPLRPRSLTPLSIYFPLDPTREAERTYAPMKCRSLQFLLVVLLAVLALSTPSGAFAQSVAPTTVTISGTVIDEAGLPVPNVLFSLADTGTTITTTTTDANGAYSIMVFSGWSGTIKPVSPDSRAWLAPGFRIYSNIQADSASENYRSYAFAGQNLAQYYYDIQYKRDGKSIPINQIIVTSNSTPTASEYITVTTSSILLLNPGTEGKEALLIRKKPNYRNLPTPVIDLIYTPAGFNKLQSEATIRTLIVQGELTNLTTKNAFVADIITTSVVKVSMTLAGSVSMSPFDITPYRAATNILSYAPSLAPGQIQLAGVSLNALLTPRENYKSISASFKKYRRATDGADVFNRAGIGAEPSIFPDNPSDLINPPFTALDTVPPFYAHEVNSISVSGASIWCSDFNVKVGSVTVKGQAVSRGKGTIEPPLSGQNYNAFRGDMVITRDWIGNALKSSVLVTGGDIVSNGNTWFGGILSKFSAAALNIRSAGTQAVIGGNISQTNLVSGVLGDPSSRDIALIFATNSVQGFFTAGSRNDTDDPLGIVKAVSTSLTGSLDAMFIFMDPQQVVQGRTPRVTPATLSDIVFGNINPSY